MVPLPWRDGYVISKLSVRTPVQNAPSVHHPNMYSGHLCVASQAPTTVVDGRPEQPRHRPWYTAILTERPSGVQMQYPAKIKKIWVSPDEEKQKTTHHHRLPDDSRRAHASGVCKDRSTTTLGWPSPSANSLLTGVPFETRCSACSRDTTSRSPRAGRPARRGAASAPR